MFSPIRLAGTALFTALLQQRQVVEFFTLPEPEPPRGLLTVILESFVMVGVFLGTTIVLGIGFGVFRLWLLKKYPDNPFNGRGKDLPRLDLN